MEGLNKISCAADVKNTGICECFFDPKLLIGGILVPRKKVFTADELSDANIQATLEDLVAEDRKFRIFPMQGWVYITDGSEEPTIQTFGYGTKEPVKEGHYNWTFGFRNGGLNLSNALRSFNGLTNKYALILIENQNNLIGTTKKDVNGEDGLAGIPLEVLYTFPWKANTGSELASYRINFDFLPHHVNDLIAFKKVTTSSYVLSELVGLEDIHLSDLGGTGTTQQIGAETDCGSTNLYDLFADEFAHAAAWQAFDSDGGVIVVSNAVKNATLKCWTLTLASAPHTITMASPSVLATAPISVPGYESDTLTIGAGS